MKSIKKVIIEEIVINKSKFINYLIPVSNLIEVEENLKFLKGKYRDANHHCYAYIIGNNQEIQKYNDDGEPNKTAGFPMMEVMKKHDLTNALNVSIRYFGGIKLGAGGLTRAYTKGCALAISKAKFSYLVNYTEVLVKVPFEQIGKVEKFLRENYILLDTKYDNLVNYYIKLITNDLPSFKSTINNFTKGIAKIDVLKNYDKYK